MQDLILMSVSYMLIISFVNENAVFPVQMASLLSSFKFWAFITIDV